MLARVFLKNHENECFGLCVCSSHVKSCTCIYIDIKTITVEPFKKLWLYLCVISDEKSLICTCCILFYHRVLFFNLMAAYSVLFLNLMAAYSVAIA